MLTALKAERQRRDLTQKQVADAVGCNPINIYRIEKGQQLPRRELARALHGFFEGKVSMGEIYDPEYCNERELDEK